MKPVRLAPSARAQLREIRKFSAERWGIDRADRYIRELSATFDAIAAGRVHGRKVPPTIAPDGYFCSHGSHLIYWQASSDGAVAIVAVLHQRMDQVSRAQEAFKNIY